MLGAISVNLDPVEVGTPVTASASFNDIGTLDTHTALWDWGDESTSVGAIDQDNDVATVNHVYNSAGVYTVKLIVTDDNTGQSNESVFRYIIVYDTSAGLVTGGGWIDSPEGAYTADSTLTGKANFGFVSKYKKGADVPIGQTEFQFKVADLNFY